MSKDKKSVNITVKIKYGKHMPDATFELEADAEMNVYNHQGKIICLSMWIGGKQMDQDYMERYFTNKSNYDNIETKWNSLCGEIG